VSHNSTLHALSVSVDYTGGDRAEKQGRVCDFDRFDVAFDDGRRFGQPHVIGLELLECQLRTSGSFGVLELQTGFQIRFKAFGRSRSGKQRINGDRRAVRQFTRARLIWEPFVMA